MHALTSPEKQLFDLGVSLYNHNCDVISLPYFPDLRKVFLEFYSIKNRKCIIFQKLFREVVQFGLENDISALL